jgi:hypothetical protein
LSGAEDRVIAARVNSEGRILLTLDLDFDNTLESSCCDWRSRTRLPLWPMRPGLQQLWASGARLVSCWIDKKITSAFAPAVELSETLVDFPGVI